jgi:hypothetical protein
MTMIARSPDADEEVARRAYALWEAEGRPQGRDRDHWERAKRDAAPAEARAPAEPPKAAPAPEGADQAVTETVAPTAAPKRRKPPVQAEKPESDTVGETVAPTKKPARRRTAKPES